MIEVTREYCPLSRRMGYKATHYFTGKSTWNDNRQEAINRLIIRLQSENPGSYNYHVIK